MPFRFFGLVIICVALSIAHCKKETSPADEPQEEHVPQFLLKTVNYNTFNARADFTYHADSTLKQIAYSGLSGGGYQTDFEYENGRIKSISASNSLYTNFYYYDNAGRITTVFHGLYGQEERGHKFDYTYNSNGSVKQMKYYDRNEAGDQLKYTNTYSYNAQGVLQSVEAVNGSNKIIFTIESYSDECSFNPWTFINTGLTQFYEIYNYPVLRSLKRLPNKITQTNVNNGGTPVITAVFEINFTITNQKLEKAVTTVSYPGNPGSNTRSEAAFYYY